MPNLPPIEVKVTADTAQAETKLKAVGVSVDNVKKKSILGAGGARMLTQQLSQVAQQATATGRPMQALAVQAADIGMAFGAVGTAVGAIVGIALPSLIAAFGDGATASRGLENALEDVEDALKGTSEIAKILAGDFDAMIERYGGLSAAMSGLARAEGEIGLRNLADASRQLNDELTALYDGNAWLNVSRAEDLANGLRLSTKESRYFAQEMASLGRESSLDEQLAIVTRMREEFVRSVGPVGAMTKEQFQFFTHLVDSEKTLGALIQRANELSAAVGSAANEAARFMFVMNNVQGGRGGDPRQFENDKYWADRFFPKPEVMAKRVEVQRRAYSSSLAAAREYQEALTEVERMGSQERMGLIGGAFGDLAGLMNTENQKLFKIGKAAAIAEATISGYQAAVDAWAKGMKVGGPPVAAAFAGASLAKTGALIAGISSQSIGGGGGTTSTGGGTATTSATSQPLDVRVSGISPDSIFTGASVQSLLDRLSDAAGDRGLRILVAQ